MVKFVEGVSLWALVDRGGNPDAAHRGEGRYRVREVYTETLRRHVSTLNTDQRQHLELALVQDAQRSGSLGSPEELV